MKHITTVIMGALFVLGTAAPAYAQTPSHILRIFTGPTVSGVSATSATFALTDVMSVRLTADQKARMYYEYTKPQQVCPAIYPPPPECLPKTTPKGAPTTTVTTLEPNTTYLVVYKYDNTIQCIKAPCPDNSFESDPATFTTSSNGSSTPTGTITAYLGLGSHGAQVTLLQNILITKGFMTAPATGYYGPKTMRAVKAFQKSLGITPTGFVGPRTLKALNS